MKRVRLVRMIAVAGLMSACLSSAALDLGEYRHIVSGLSVSVGRGLSLANDELEAARTELVAIGIDLVPDRVRLSVPFEKYDVDTRGRADDVLPIGGLEVRTIGSMLRLQFGGRVAPFFGIGTAFYSFDEMFGEMTANLNNSFGVESGAGLRFTLLDNVTEWDETWYTLRCDIEDQLEQTHGSQRSTWPVWIGHSFLPLDLTASSTFQSFPARFAGVDVFILNFVVSELIEDIDNLADVIRLLVERTGSNSYFLIMDRMESRVLKSVGDIAAAADLHTIDRCDQGGHMDYDEQKSELDDWDVELEWSPKVTLNAFCILAGRGPSIDLSSIPF